jgi:amidase
MVPFAQASDGGGSIRIPASAHGLFGFKPSRGRCLSAGPNDMWGLLIEHCVSRSVRDSARFLAFTADPASSLPTLGPLERKQRKLRIGYYGITSMGRSPTPEVASLLESAAQLCASLGHEVEAVQAPAVDGPTLSHAFFVLAGAGMSGLEQMMQPMLGRPLGEQDLEPFTRELIAWFRGLPADSTERALKDIEREGQVMRTYAERFDAVLCPTMPAPPPVLGALAPTKCREELVRLTEDVAGYTALYTMGGLPAMSVPLYQSAQGLPIGMHFAARLGDEATLFSLAFQLEEAAPWVGRWPALVA